MMSKKNIETRAKQERDIHDIYNQKNCRVVVWKKKKHIRGRLEVEEEERECLEEHANVANTNFFPFNRNKKIGSVVSCVCV